MEKKRQIEGMFINKKIITNHNRPNKNFSRGPSGLILFRYYIYIAL